MAKRIFKLDISKNTDWMLADINIQDIHEGEHIGIFGILNHKDGKIISGFDQDVTKEDIKEAKKIKAFLEEVEIKVIVDDGLPKYKIVSTETFKGQLIDALIYVHKINRQKDG